MCWMAKSKNSCLRYCLITDDKYFLVYLHEGCGLHRRYRVTSSRHEYSNISGASLMRIFLSITCPHNITGSRSKKHLESSNWHLSFSKKSQTENHCFMAVMKSVLLTDIPYIIIHDRCHKSSYFRDSITQNSKKSLKKSILHDIITRYPVLPCASLLYPIGTAEQVRCGRMTDIVNAGIAKQNTIPADACVPKTCF